MKATWWIVTAVLAVIVAWGLLGKRAAVREARAAQAALAATDRAHALIVAERDSVDAERAARELALEAENASLKEEVAATEQARQVLAVHTDDLISEVRHFDRTLARQIDDAMALERVQWQRQVDFLHQRISNREQTIELLQDRLLARDSTIAEQAVQLQAYAVRLDKTIHDLSPGFQINLKTGWPTLVIGFVGGIVARSLVPGG